MQCADRLYWAAAILVSVAMYFLAEKPFVGLQNKTAQKMHAGKAR